MIGPIQIDVHVHLVDGQDASKVAKVTFGCTPGEVPDENAILVAIGASLRAVRQSLPEASLMSARDFFNGVLVKEKTGRVGNFAVPASMDYDVEDLTVQALIAAEEDHKVTAAAAKAAKRPDTDVEIEDEEQDDGDV